MWKVLLAMSWRSLLAHRGSSGLVAMIIAFGAFLVVLGTTLIESIDQSMSQSIVASVAGHLQVYSADARDELALYGSGFMADDDLGELRDADALRQLLEAQPNVKAAVPMGIVMTMVTRGGSEIDRALEDLRDAQAALGDEPAPRLTGALGQQEAATMYERSRARLRKIATEMLERAELGRDLALNVAKVDKDIETLRRVLSDAFWQQATQDFGAAVAFLDEELAPLGENGKLDYFRNLGCDLQRFAKLFDRFELVSGELPPAGERGILLAERLYERRLKLKVARVLDTIKEGRDKRGKTIAGDSKLATMARRLPDKYREVTYQLSEGEVVALAATLAGFLAESRVDGAGAAEYEGEPGDAREELNWLLRRFLAVDDQVFDASYGFFYREIAPLLDLHWVKVGGNLLVRSVTKSGYYRGLQLPVWGIYRFSGLEDSDLAGAMNLVDMDTFRALYGVMTPEMQAELSELRNEVGIEDVSREGAESALFGGDNDDDGQEVGEVVSASKVPIAHGLAQAGTSGGDIALNAAIILEDAELQDETMASLMRLSSERELGFQVVGWRQAAGMVGQFVAVMRGVLLVAIAIIFLVALVIINNALVMSTSERTIEIGTLRAIGAQRRFVLASIVFEAGVLSLFSGGLGVLSAWCLVVWLGATGIPAWNDVTTFLFSGARLFPEVDPVGLIGAVVAVGAVALLSSFYPAYLATRVEPAEAMADRE